jgi:hypothetical protein
MIGRLEALLARVRSRAAAPRSSQSAKYPEQQPASDDAEDLEDLPRQQLESTEVDIVVEVDGDEAGKRRADGLPSGMPVTGPKLDIAASDGPSPRSTTPPSANVPSAPLVRDRNDEASGGRAFDSRERLVAAESIASEGLGEPRDAAAVQAPPSEEGPAAVPSAARFDESATEEVSEKSPASSRRPVAPEPEEQLAEMAFGIDEPLEPLHTPPPESGRLPTAADAASRSAPKLFPESIRADLVTSHNVAEVIGEAQRFAPSRFVTLLDASLGL